MRFKSSSCRRKTGKRILLAKTRAMSSLSCLKKVKSLSLKKDWRMLVRRLPISVAGADANQISPTADREAEAKMRFGYPDCHSILPNSSFKKWMARIEVGRWNLNKVMARAF
jgi:hypothetical protein